MATKITQKTFTAALEKAVAEKGESYKYPDSERAASAYSDNQSAGVCSYRNQYGEPSCLIGYALFLIDPELLPEREYTYSSTVLLRSLGVEDNVLIESANIAQTSQDQGRSWGKSLERYKERLNLTSSE